MRIEWGPLSPRHNYYSHIVQDERKQISCESPLAWRRGRLDAAWMQLCL